MTPTAWQLLLGGDPAPGDTGVLGGLQSRVADASKQTDQAVGVLQSIGGSSATWCGPAATAFRTSSVEQLLKQLRDLRGAYDGVAAALRTYLPELDGHQREAVAIARRAEVADAAARSDPNRMMTPTATTIFGGVSAELAAVQRDRDELAGRALASAKRCASAVTAAVAPVKAYEPGAATKFGRFLVDQIEDLNKALKSIKWAISVLALITTPIPGVGEAMNLINVAVGVTILATDVVLATQGREKWSETGKDAMGVGLDIAGAGAAGKTRAAVREAYGARSAEDLASSAGNRAESKAWDGIADVTGRMPGQDSAVTTVYSRAQAQALHNQAELDSMAGQYYKGLSEAPDPNAAQRIEEGFGELRQQIGSDGLGSLNPVTQWKNWSPLDGAAGRWQTTEISIGSFNTGMDVGDAFSGKAEAEPQPTGWRG